MALLYTLTRIDGKTKTTLCTDAPMGRVLAELGKQADAIEAAARSAPAPHFKLNARHAEVSPLHRRDETTREGKARP